MTINIYKLWSLLSKEDREKILDWIKENIHVEEIENTQCDILIDNYSETITGKELPILDSGNIFETHSRSLVSFQCLKCNVNEKTENGVFETIFVHILREHILEIIPDFEEKYEIIFEECVICRNFLNQEEIFKCHLGMFEDGQFYHDGHEDESYIICYDCFYNAFPEKKQTKSEE